MINNLALRITEKMLKSGGISEEEKELYIYGLFMIISQVMFFAFSCALGLIFGCFVESVIFYISFAAIRKFAGGYHAATEARCEISSALSLLACVGVIRLSKIYDFRTALLCAAAMCAVLIFAFCPLDTPEKPLGEKEFKYFRKVSCIILFVICSAIIAAFIFKVKLVFVPCCAALVLEGVLITAGKAQRVLGGKKEKSDSFESV